MKNTKHNIKYYIYLRKSSESEEKQIQSIERQADEVHKLVTYQGLQVAGTFQESRSAMTPNNRPEFTKMIRGLKAGKANGIICWHINRLARNPLESGIVQQLLEDGKIQSIITKDREYTSADNAIIFSVESSLATQYSKDLGKMVKSGMDKKASLGIAPIKAPLGYLNTKMAEHGSNYIIKDKERFAIVRSIWDMMLSGMYPPSKIQAIVTNEMGLKTKSNGKFFTKILPLSGVYNILNNPFYAGLFLYKGKLYTGKHEAMITVEEFEKVQKMLGRKGNPRYQKKQFAYTGIMQCEECGCAITAAEKTKLIKSTGLYKNYIYYYCTNRKAGIQCQSRKPLTVFELENQIVEEMENVSISQTFQNVALAILKQNSSSLKSTKEVICENQKREISSVEKELKNLLQLRISDMINDEEYKLEKEQRDKKLIFLKQKIEQEKLQPYQVIENIETLFESITDIKNKFIESTEEDKKKLFIRIGENFTLRGKKLNIIKPKWLTAVQKYKKEVEAELDRLELEKYLELKDYPSYFGDVFPALSALVKEVRTESENLNKTPVVDIDISQAA
jgi:site-specific DNA recombinase